MWGGALPGTVRSLLVMVENREEVVIPSVRVQHERTRTMRNFCSDDSYAVKSACQQGEFSTGKKIKQQLFRA